MRGPVDTFDHRRIQLIRAAIEVDKGARRPGHQQRRPQIGRCREKLFDKSILGRADHMRVKRALREEIRQNLETLKSDADLVADARLGEQAKAMLNVLASGADVAPQIERVMAALKPDSLEAQPPSQETLQLSQASSEEIDA